MLPSASNWSIVATLLFCIHPLLNCSKTDETQTDSSTAETTGQDGATPPIHGGIGTDCVVNDDCAEFGLNCIKDGKNDPNATCSKPCVTGEECPIGTTCGDYAGQQICVPNELCSSCDISDECGLNAPFCKKDDQGSGFCTQECNPSSPSCIPGHKCYQPDPTDDRFFCGPIAGACRGEGTHCSPCLTQSDCNEGTVCYTSPATGERFCAAECEATEDCPRETECLPTTDGKLCIQRVGDQLMATCLAGALSFCQACDFGFQCETNMCHTMSEQGTSFCTIQCTGQQDKINCPKGTFCVYSNVSPTGFGCSPSLAYKCSGWLNCKGIECDPGLVCDKGWCVEVDP